MAVPQELSEVYLLDDGGLGGHQMKSESVKWVAGVARRPTR
jgi:hypothetical protein